MKSYTDLEQSKVLAEILPFESADMYYIMYRNGEKPQNGDANLSTVYESNEHKWYWVDIIDESWDIRIGKDIPCWSLTALLDVLPSGYVIVKNHHSFYYAESRDHKKSTHIFNNPIDACVEMILKLHEQNLL